mgnify:FL=1
MKEDSKNKTEKRRVGDICEGIAVKHLVKLGLNVVERNYLRKWGELDVIAEDVSHENHVLHFIEVKGAVTRENIEDKKPEENVHYWKQQRIWRAIQTWLMEHEEYEEVDWQIDVMAVFLDLERKKARIRWIKNIVLEI